MKEWREIDGFPNYMVSNTGEIKSLNYNKTGKEKVLSIAEAARTVNNGNIKAAVTNILKCCNGVADTQFGTVKRKTAYGYIWKFKTL